MGRKSKSYREAELHVASILNELFYDYVFTECDTMTNLERADYLAVMMHIMNKLDSKLDKETISLLGQDE